ncbi:MAG: hypothetical protein Q9188_002736 [Gyalolechia gomerana]
MAEFVLATVGLAVAVPGVAVSFVKCGEYIKNLADKFTNASSAIQDIRAFGLDLHRGKLRLNLELAEWAFSLSNLDPVVKDAVEDSLAQLRVALIDTAGTLDGFFDKRGDLRRTHFAFLGERKANRTLSNLRRWQGDFESIIDLIDKQQRIVPNNLVLGRDKLRVIHQLFGQDYVPVPGSSHLVADCEFNDKGIHTIKILIERRTMLEDMDQKERTAVLSTLASRLCTNRARQGILRCLGYRDKKTPELVFELPEEVRTVQSLGATMMTSQATVNGGYPLQARITLTRRLCEAVLCVHTSGLVHKSIRPDTVLLVQQASDPQDALGSAYLTDWFMLRKVTELSSRRGSDNWTEDFYRHPRRQGRQPEERYNMGHDIYSLGILLLEVCLWEPFVQPWRNPPVSQLYETRATDLNIISTTGSDVIDELTMPLNIYKVINNLAETEVAPRMGTPLATFIISCLQCLDGKVDGLREQDFKSSSTTAAMRFREMIIDTFQVMSVA